MRTAIVKMLFLVPILLFIDWIIMVIGGIFSNMCGADDQFFRTSYCYFGIVLLIITFLLFVFLLHRVYLDSHQNIQRYQ